MSSVEQSQLHGFYLTKLRRRRFAHRGECGQEPRGGIPTSDTSNGNGYPSVIPSVISSVILVIRSARKARPKSCQNPELPASWYTTDRDIAVCAKEHLRKVEPESRMANGDESLPLVGPPNGAGHRDQRIMLAITAFAQILTMICCAPPLVAMWHPYYFPNSEIEQRAWSWLGVNSFWFSLPLVWTVFHRDNGPAAAAGCLLCAFYWAYIDVAMLSEWMRGLLSFSAVGDFILHFVLCAFCARAAWGGVASPVHASRADGSNTRKRAFRKWALVLASLQVFVVYLACWPLGLPIVPDDVGRESAPWEWNAATLLTLTLAILWAAFLTRGGYVDQTKQAMCGFCAIMFLGGFVLSSFDWPYLGLVGHNIISTAVLAADAVVLAIAALN